MDLNNMPELSRVNKELKREIAERLKAEEELEQRNMLLSTLLEVSNLVSSTMELKPLLEAILDRLKTIIDYSGAKVFIIEGEIVKVVAHRSPLTDEEEQNYVFPYGQFPLTREIILNRKPVLIPDVQSNDPMARAFRETVGERVKTT